MLFCKANVDQAQVVAKVLNKFCAVSGLKVNLAKSNFICSKWVAHVVKHVIEEILGIRCTPHIGKYLGFKIIFW